MSQYILYTKIIGAENVKTIVFLPGFTGSHNMWDSQFLELGKQYRLVLVDTLGFGNSPKPEDIDYSVEDHLAALRNTLQSINLPDTVPCHVIGYSMGCLLALAYSAKFPQAVDRLVLLALPLYRGEEEAREIIGKKSSLFNRWLAIDTTLAHIACTIMCTFRPFFIFIVPMLVRNLPVIVVKDALRHTWISYSKTLQNVIFKAPTFQWLRQIQCPILIIQGKKDRVAPLENVRVAISDLSNVALYEVDSDHELVFKQSKAIAAQLKVFFSRADNSIVF